MLGLAFLLPLLTWIQAAGAAVLALLFNLFILPYLEVDLRERAEVAPGFSPASDSTLESAALKGGATAEPATNTWTGIILYPISVLALILIYRHSMHVVAAVWGIMALGDSMAGVAGEALRGPVLPYNREKTWFGSCAFILAGTLGAYILIRWVAPSLPADKALVVSAATAAVGALVESLPIRLDDNVSVPIVCGGFMFCAYLVERSALDSNLPYLKLRIILAVAVNLVLAPLALGLKWVNSSGAAAGLILGVAVYMGYGYKSFSILLAFFLLGSMATRLGYAKKAARGIAERRGGARSWREALANSLAGAFFAILVIITHLSLIHI